MRKYDFDFKGKLVIEARSRDEAQRLISMGFNSIGVAGDICGVMCDVWKRPELFTFDIESFKFTLYGNSFEEVDTKVLKMIKTICVEYHYDPKVMETVYNVH